jgi:hypothetical protein
MKNSQDAILRCANRINSFVPSRIIGTDFSLIGREGTIKINFDYEAKAYEFTVPFIRPFTDKKNLKFANLLNLNQKRGEKNLLFEEFIIRVTNNYSVNPAKEIACRITILSQGGAGDLDDPNPITIPNLPPLPPSSSANAAQAMQFEDSDTHYIVFADLNPNSFCFQKLTKYFNKIDFTKMLSQVNDKYETGSTYRDQNTSPFLTIIPFFDKSKGNVSEEDFLHFVFKDIAKSQNDYFKKPSICMVYSSQGFPDRVLFEEGWNKVAKLLKFTKDISFLVE